MPAEVALSGSMRPQPYRVTEVLRELDDVVTLRLAAEDRAPLAFRPGQFNMLYAFAIGEIPISISGDPSRPDELLHTVRRVGAVSSALAQFERGAVLGLRGPFGSHWPVETERGRHLLFVAGGLGLAPLRPAICRALARRADYAGITLVLGARSPREILYAWQLAGWAAAGAMKIHVCVDHAGPEWGGPVGVVTSQFPRALDGIAPDRVSVFLCGPEIMMRHGCGDLEHLGIHPERMWISMERNMKCATGLCGHCQFGADFVCRDGPVFRYRRVSRLLGIREV